MTHTELPADAGATQPRRRTTAQRGARAQATPSFPKRGWSHCLFPNMCTRRGLRGPGQGRPLVVVSFWQLGQQPAELVFSFDHTQAWQTGSLRSRHPGEGVERASARRPRDGAGGGRRGAGRQPGSRRSALRGAQGTEFNRSFREGSWIQDFGQETWKQAGAVGCVPLCPARHGGRILVENTRSFAAPPLRPPEPRDTESSQTATSSPLVRHQVGSPQESEMLGWVPWALQGNLCSPTTDAAHDGGVSGRACLGACTSAGLGPRAPTPLPRDSVQKPGAEARSSGRPIPPPPVEEGQSDKATSGKGRGHSIGPL